MNFPARLILRVGYYTRENIFSMHVVTVSCLLAVCLLPRCIHAVSPYTAIHLRSYEQVEVTSPNYPDDYGSNADKLWKIEAPSGYSVRLHFLDFETERRGDYVIIHNDTSDALEQAPGMVRVSFSGSSIPRNVTSMYSSMWIRFRSNSAKQYQGFRAMADAVSTPDWFGEFYGHTCGLTINNGTWDTSHSGNQFFAQAFSPSDPVDVASFTIPYTPSSMEGTLKFAYYSLNPGSLSVSVCRSQPPTSYDVTNLRIVDECIQYSCNDTQDVEISFTATRADLNSRINVDDIKLYETSVSSTVHTPGPSLSHDTASSVAMMEAWQCPIIYDHATTSTASKRNTLNASPYSDEATTVQPSRGVRDSAAISTVSSVFFGIVIALTF